MDFTPIRSFSQEGQRAIVGIFPYCRFGINCTTLIRRRFESFQDLDHGHFNIDTASSEFVNHNWYNFPAAEILDIFDCPELEYRIAVIKDVTPSVRNAPNAYHSARTDIVFPSGTQGFPVNQQSSSSASSASSNSSDSDDSE